MILLSTSVSGIEPLGDGTFLITREEAEQFRLALIEAKDYKDLVLTYREIQEKTSILIGEIKHDLDSTKRACKILTLLLSGVTCTTIILALKMSISK